MARKLQPVAGISKDEAFGFLAEKIRKQAREPNITAYKPHYKQELFHRSVAKVKLYIGGNRSGKTHGGVVEDIYRLKGQHPYRSVPEAPIRGRAVCVDFRQGINEILIPKFKQLMPPSLLRDGSWDRSYNTTEKKLTCANGSTLEFMTYEQSVDAFAGTSRHFCADEDTECLTKRGWLSYDEVTTEDFVLSYNNYKSKTEWTKVTEVYVAPVAEYLNRYSSKGVIDALVTNDHRWLVFNKKNKKVYFNRNYNLKKSEQFIISAEHFNNNNKVWSDKIVKLVGWIATDGTYGNGGMSISQSETWNLDKCKEIEDLYNGTKTIVSSGHVIYSIVGELRLLLLSIFNTGYKIIPMSFINELTLNQQNMLLETIIKGDGMQTITGGFIVSQKIKERRDSIMALGVLCGYTTTAYKNQTTYNIQFKRKDGRYDYSKSSVDSYDTVKEYYEGYVWCPNNLNSSWVARRNGRVYITGNCHFDEEPPQGIYNECMARLIDTNGDAYITMTPLLGMTWVHDKIYIPGLERLNTDIAVITVDMTENPYLSEEARERYLATLDEDERAARKSGTFISMGGLIYKKFDEKIHTTEFSPELLEICKTAEISMSLDYGYNAPTSVHWHAAFANGTIITFGEHYKSEMIISDHAKTILNYEAENGIEIDGVRVADPAIAQRNGVNGTSVQVEFSLGGVDLALGNNDVLTGIAKVQSYLRTNLTTGKPYWIIADNCVELIKEMKKYRWATYSSSKLRYDSNPQEKAHKKDDHAVDECRYYFSFMPDLSPEPVAKSVPPEVVSIERFDPSFGLSRTNNASWLFDTDNVASLEYE